MILGLVFWARAHVLLIVAIGDSKTVGSACCESSGGYRSELKRRLLATGVPVVFRGVYATGGVTIAVSRAGIDAYLAWKWTLPQPDWAIVNLGTNDLVLMPGRPEQEADLGHILDALHSKWPTCQTLVLRPWAPGREAEAETLAARIAYVVSSRPWAHLGPDESAFLPGRIDRDRVHPTIAGYQATERAIQLAIGY